MNTKVKFFALGKELVGESELDLEFSEPVSVKTLVNQLKKDFPRLAELNSFLIAVNMEYADMATIVRDGDEVAIIPPVSGG